MCRAPSKPITEKVSIIIPVYNVEPYIEDCVRSVTMQTHDNLEIILVDDCGSDNSMQLAEHILTQSSQEWRSIKHAGNRGLSAARNTGADAATGDYLYFLDSDDYINPVTIEQLLHAAHQHDADITFGCGFVLLMPDSSLKPIWKDTAESLHELDAFHAYLRQEHTFMAQHRLIRRSAYMASGIRFQEGLVHEDILWSLQMARSGLSICSAPGHHLYFYRQRSTSIMAQSKSSPKKIEGYTAATRAHYQLMVQEELHRDPEFCRMYAYIFHTTVNMIMADSAASARSQCRAIAAYLREFDFCIQEIESTFRFLKAYTTLARFMPALLARKISALLSC